MGGRVAGLTLDIERGGYRYGSARGYAAMMAKERNLRLKDTRYWLGVVDSPATSRILDAFFDRLPTS